MVAATLHKVRVVRGAPSGRFLAGCAGAILHVDNGDLGAGRREGGVAGGGRPGRRTTSRPCDFGEVAAIRIHTVLNSTTLDPPELAPLIGHRVEVIVRDNHGRTWPEGWFDAIVTAFDLGATPDEIVQRYPSVDLASAYTLIADTLRHRDSVEAYLAGRDRAGAETRADIEARFPPDGMRARLLARRAARQ